MLVRLLPHVVRGVRKGKRGSTRPSDKRTSRPDARAIDGRRRAGDIGPRRWHPRWMVQNWPTQRFLSSVEVEDDPTGGGEAVWSIVCFQVRTGHRRKGVATALLTGAVAYVREMRVPAIEAYPIDCEGQRVQSAAAHVGTAAMFEAAGFKRVLESQARSANLPRWIYRLELTN